MCKLLSDTTSNNDQTILNRKTMRQDFEIVTLSHSQKDTHPLQNNQPTYRQSHGQIDRRREEDRDRKKEVEEEEPLLQICKVE